MKTIYFIGTQGFVYLCEMKGFLFKIVSFIFSFFTKKLRGKITDKPSGISILLPKGWAAIDIEQGSFLIAADKEIGMLVFTITHLAIVEKSGKFINPYTGVEEEIESVEEGNFRSYIIEGPGEREWAKVWNTETETYLIRLMYMCSKTNKEKEMETILQIINSVEEGSQA